jgi:hypothetical protein
VSSVDVEEQLRNLRPALDVAIAEAESRVSDAQPRNATAIGAWATSGWFADAYWILLISALCWGAEICDVILGLGVLWFPTWVASAASHQARATLKFYLFYFSRGWSNSQYCHCQTYSW